MSKRLVALSEAFDIIDWNILLLSLEQFVTISGSLLMILKNGGIEEGVDTQDQVLVVANWNSHHALNILLPSFKEKPQLSSEAPRFRSSCRLSLTPATPCPMGLKTSVSCLEANCLVSSRQTQPEGSLTALAYVASAFFTLSVKSLTTFMFSF